MSRVQQLRKARVKLDAQIKAAALKEWPVGSTVYYRKFGGEISATVLQHCYGENVFVRSHTGKEYQISYYDLLGYAG